MNSSPELVAVVQQERERHIEQDRLARLAECARSCCSMSIVEALARVLRLSSPA